MRPFLPRFVVVASAGLVTATVALLAAPVVPSASAASTACEVTGATMTWGFKESFRSYISSSIANGEWTTGDGASYATPSFMFTGGSGTYDPTSATGSVALPGTISFTGHGGLLQTSVAHPTVSFTGPGTAQLLLDVSTVPMDQAMAGDTTVHTATQVPFVSLDLSGASVTDDAGALTITGTGLPTTMTAEGFEAFGSYDAGTPFDPMDLTIHATCAAPSPSPSPSPTAAPVVAETASSASPTVGQTQTDAPTPWLGWVAGGGAAIIVAAGAAWWVRSRRGSGNAAAVDGDRS